MSNKNEKVICCGVLEKMSIGWMCFEDGTKAMAYIPEIEGDTKFRVNYCPSCGANIRESQSSLNHNTELIPD